MLATVLGRWRDAKAAERESAELQAKLIFDAKAAVEAAAEAAKQEAARAERETNLFGADSVDNFATVEAIYIKWSDDGASATYTVFVETKNGKYVSNIYTSICEDSIARDRAKRHMQDLEFDVEIAKLKANADVEDE